jgi:6-pyruvoyltetrahydropterin/6-carboxytetrahydropterin synthase
MYRISKRFTFEAAHWLSGLPSGHKCGREHGHSYTVEVIVAAELLSAPGFVVDFADLDPLKQHVNNAFDHRLLNEAVAVEPTSENLARVVFDWCTAKLPLPITAAVEAVRISETATTWAEYRPEPAPTRT